MGFDLVFANRAIRQEASKDTAQKFASKHVNIKENR
jgi:hypothetical protein